MVVSGCSNSSDDMTVASEHKSEADLCYNYVSQSHPTVQFVPVIITCLRCALVSPLDRIV